MSKKIYPLEIVAAHEPDSGGLQGFWSKGHHDPEAFATELETRHGYMCDLDCVRHTWYRYAFMHGDRETQWLLDVAGPGRGVFPATTVYDGLRWLRGAGVA